MPRICYYLEL